MIEYRAEPKPSSANSEDFEDVLEDLGLNGWDFVAEMSCGDSCMWLFKRNRSFVVGWNRKLMRRFASEPVTP